MKTARILSHLFVVGAICTICTAASGEDWPQWRGPQRNGISEETGLLKQWPAKGPQLVWQAKDLGGGYSTPSVVGNRLYMLSNEGVESEFVMALDAETGERVWTTTIGRVGNPDQRPSYPGTRGTPTVDGQRLYVLGSDGDLACLDRSSGDIIWKKNLRSDFGGQPGTWAYSESPLVDGDALVCTPGGSRATMVCLNKASGETIWEAAIPDGGDAGYASCIILELNGEKQYVQFVQKGVVGVDAESGKFLWRYDQTAQGSAANIPTPVSRGAFVYSAAGQSGGGLVKLSIEPAGVDAEPVYYSPELPNSIGGTVEIDGYLYGTHRRGLMCVEFESGEVLWRDPSVGAGSICYADQRLYVHGENGEVALVEATSEGYREKGRFTPVGQPDRSRGRLKAWTYPVIANGRLYIHDLGMLWCYDIQDR